MAPPAPPEMTPEFIAYSNEPILLAQTAPIYAIAALVVLGRCYVRALIVKSFRWDDWTMALTMVRMSMCKTVLSADHHVIGVRNSVLCSICDGDPSRHWKARGCCPG
jgi:hypothetical protein